MSVNDELYNSQLCCVAGWNGGNLLNRCDFLENKKPIMQTIEYLFRNCANSGGFGANKNYFMMPKDVQRIIVQYIYQNKKKKSQSLLIEVGPFNKDVFEDLDLYKKRGRNDLIYECKNTLREDVELIVESIKCRLETLAYYELSILPRVLSFYKTLYNTFEAGNSLKKLQKEYSLEKVMTNPYEKDSIEELIKMSIKIENFITKSIEFCQKFGH